MGVGQAGRQAGSGVDTDEAMRRCPSWVRESACPGVPARVAAVTDWNIDDEGAYSFLNAKWSLVGLKDCCLGT